MALNHLNLTVPDGRQTRAFFETYFGFRCIAERQSDALVVLVDESGFVLTLNNFVKAAQRASWCSPDTRSICWSISRPFSVRYKA